MRREIKFKKVIYTELPPDFVLFKQYNISAKQMYQNLLGLHAADASNQEVITIDDIYAITDSMDSLTFAKSKKKTPTTSQKESESVPVSWPPEEEDFVIALEEDGWSLGSVQSYQQENDCISVQSLSTLKTRAKDDKGKTYWVYPDEQVSDTYQKKHILDIRPSVTVAKNIKRKDLVFALLNREVIESICSSFYPNND